MQRHDSRRLEILRHSGELPPREHDVMAAACVSGSYDLTSQYAAAERRRGRRRVSGAMPALAKGRDGLREDGEEEEEKVDGGDGEEKEQDDKEEEEEEGVEEGTAKQLGKQKALEKGVTEERDENQTYCQLCWQSQWWHWQHLS